MRTAFEQLRFAAGRVEDSHGAAVLVGDLGHANGGLRCGRQGERCGEEKDRWGVQ